MRFYVDTFAIRSSAKNRSIKVVETILQMCSHVINVAQEQIVYKNLFGTFFIIIKALLPVQSTVTLRVTQEFLILMKAVTSETNYAWAIAFCNAISRRIDIVLSGLYSNNNNNISKRFSIKA